MCRNSLSCGVLGVLLTVAFWSPIAWGAEMTEYRIVFIRTGPATDVDPEARREAFEGHFSNMTEMGEAGDLLVAGPFMDPRPDPMHRGLWIFDTDSDERAEALAATDPPGQLGIFVFETLALVTDAPLRECPRLEQAYERRRLGDPDIPDEWTGRAYRIAMIEAPGHDAPARVEGVVFDAVIKGRERNPETHGVDHRFVLLVADDDDAGREILTYAGCDADAWTLHGWYSTPTLTELSDPND